MTKMAARYSSYELSQGLTAATSVISQQLQFQKQQHRHMPEVLKKIKENPRQQLKEQEQSSYILSTAGSSSVATVTEADAAAKNINTPKNYFVPLHVDCSVEYELPKQPKPPAGQRVEPLLMIHPCYFRKMESQRRSPFINNMPNSSRNGGMLVGVAFVSQGSSIAPASASTLSLKRTSFRNHYNTRENLSSQYGSIRNPEQQQLQNPQHHKLQHNLSLMPQQALYSEASSSKFLEHPSAPNLQTDIAIVNRTEHQHVICSTQTKNQNQQHPEHIIQNSSSSSKLSYPQFDQLAAVGTAVADKNSNENFSASLNNLCKVECSIAKNSALVKHDAMISSNSGYLTNLASKNNISLRIQMNKNGSKTNNISSSSEKHHNPTIARNRSRNGMSTCLVDKTKLYWNPKTNTTPSLFMVGQSSIATVPSNFQAELDTAQTRTTKLQELHNYKYRKINDNNNESVYKNNSVTSSEKFRQYLRSHRVHPYLTGTPSHSDYTAFALSSESATTDPGDFQVLPQFSTTKAVVAAVSTATSFQQHMQQISCYNVC